MSPSLFPVINLTISLVVHFLFLSFDLDSGVSLLLPASWELVGVSVGMLVGVTTVSGVLVGVAACGVATGVLGTLLLEELQPNQSHDAIRLPTGKDDQSKKNLLCTALPWQFTMATHPKLSNSLCRSMTSEGSMGTASRNYIMRQERFAASVRAAALVHWYKPSLSYKPPCTRYTMPAPRT